MESETSDVKRETGKEAISKCLFCGNINRVVMDDVEIVNKVDESAVVKSKPWLMGRVRFMVENLQEDVGHVNQGVGVVEELAEGILQDVGSLPGQVALIVDEKLARVTEILHEFKKMQRKQNHVLDQLAVRVGRIEDRLGIGEPLDTSAKEADYSGTALDTMRQKRAHHSGTGDVIDYRDETEGLRALVEHMRDNGLNENEIVEACKTAQFSEQDVRERCGDLLK